MVLVKPQESLEPLKQYKLPEKPFIKPKVNPHNPQKPMNHLAVAPHSFIQPKNP